MSIVKLLKKNIRSARGFSTLEYVLGAALLAVIVAATFGYISDSTNALGTAVKTDALNRAALVGK